MFKLNKTHRETLVEHLEKTNDAIELKNKCIQQFTENGQEDLVDSSDMDLFLLEQTKELIIKSIIDNEIDW